MTTYQWLVSVPVPESQLATEAREVEGFQASMVTFPLAYVMVQWPEDGFLDAVSAHDERRLDRIRHEFAAQAGIDVSPTVPKLGLVAHVLDGDATLFRTRQAEGGKWHPGAPGSGCIAFGAAALTLATVVNLVVPDPLATSWLVVTPAGLRMVDVCTCPDGRRGLRVRAEVEIEGQEL
jgi:hypothetical protein